MIIAAIKEINCSRLAGSILANKSNGVKCMKAIGDLLEFVFFILGCFSGFCYKVDGEVIAAVLKVACDHSKKFHIQAPLTCGIHFAQKRLISQLNLPLRSQVLLQVDRRYQRWLC